MRNESRVIAVVMGILLMLSWMPRMAKADSISCEFLPTQWELGTQL